MNDSHYDLAGRRVWVAGHKGMVGSALVRRLARDDCEIVTVERSEVDLTRQADVETWMDATKPHAVFLAAARVGGILANDSRPAEFIYENLAIEANVINAARQAGVEKLLFLGSSCVYPKLSPQPMREDVLLSGPLEPTNEWYAIAKIAGIKLCQAYRRQYGCDFISAMPTNLYGPGDNFDLHSSHVLPALLRKVHEAKMREQRTVEVWGSGRPRREFLYVDDLADALVHLMKNYSDPAPINVGTGEETTIVDLARTIAEAVGHPVEFAFDTTRPDGTPRKLLDLTRLHEQGWRSQVSLSEGIARTYQWYLSRVSQQPELT